MQHLKNSPVLRLFLAAVIISFSGVFVKTAHVPPTTSGFYRVFFGWVFLIMACLVRKEFKKRSIKNNGLAVACGFLFALDLFVWHQSILYIGPGLATVLGNFQVFVLSLTGFLFYKERISIYFILSVPLAVAGLFLVIGMDTVVLTPDYQKGIFLGLLTAVFYSAFLLLLRQVQSDEKDFSIFYYLMLLSFSCSLFLGMEMVISSKSFAIPDLESLASLIGLGFLIQMVGWVIISNALPKIRASLAGLILLLQPALAFFWDVIFFNRSTGLTGWIGLGVVLMAIYMGMIGSNRPDSEPRRVLVE